MTAIYTFTDADETVDIVVDEDEMIDTVTDVDETVDEDAETPDSDVLITFGEMSLITAGTFEMGSPSGELGRDVDEIQHTVILTINFYINTYEVTQGEFSSAMGYNPSNFSSCGDNCPVEQVNWHEALVYANKRSKQEGLDECFDCTGVSPDFECSLKTKFIKPQDCNGYRLPTESEWEYAARGNTTTAFYNGDITHTFGNDANLDLIGWYDNNSGSKTHSVGGKLANSYGLYDMCGNVWELTMDWHGTYPEGPVTDPAGADTGSLSIRRGGSCYGYARYGRSAYRGYATLTVRYTDLGFRLSRSK